MPMIPKTPKTLNTDEMVLQVTDLSRGGAGVSREASGRVLFIPFTAPGDQVRVRVIQADKRYAQAELLEVIRPSPVRVKPQCPAFGQCGGCEWQHLPYSLQWETKKKGVLHALDRVQMSFTSSIEEIPASQIWEYRNRVQLRGKGAFLGFFKPGSRDLVPVDRCDIARREINQSWEETRSQGEKRKGPYKVEVEILPSGEIRKMWNARHSAGGFRQVHDDQNERLKQWVAEQLPAGDILYDLFGGSGNLCLPLASKMREIHCVDLGAPPSLSSGHVHFHRASVVPWLLTEVEKFRQSHGTGELPVSYAIVDPPREGLADSFVEIAGALRSLGVSKVVAIGCDPDAWARDLCRWVKRGWTVEKVMVMDLFPQTHHIESVGLLT